MGPVAVLGAADVPAYLLERGVLDPRALVHGRLTVVDHSWLNGVFVVTADGWPGVVVKAGPGVAREAAVLERLGAVAGPLGRALPRVVAHDAAGEVLVLAATHGARDLDRQHARGRFSRALAREAGRALALLHAVPPATLDGLAAPPPAPPPHRPALATLRSYSAGAVELTRVVQRSRELCDGLDALLGGVPVVAVPIHGGTPAGSPHAAPLVHGDVRWGNLVAFRAPAGAWTGLQLVDWEHCGPGDPAADVGAYIGEYLCAWSRSIPVADPRDRGPLLERARVPLARMRPAVQAFWAAYAPDGAAGALLRRSLRFAGARLAVAALEEAQALDEPRPGTLALLPLAANVLSRPDDAAELLGLA